MWSSPYLWMFVAVWVFWSLGAYNRLVRLKAAADAAAAQWQTLQRRSTALALEWVTAQRDAVTPQNAHEIPGVHHLHNAVPPVADGTEPVVSPDAIHSSEPHDGPADALRAASEVLDAVLEKPQTVRDAQARMAEVQQASALLQDVWGRTMQDLKESKGAEGMGVDVAQWQARWTELQGLLAPAQKAYEDAAQSYGCAIAQFPASVLARAVGFKPM